MKTLMMTNLLTALVWMTTVRAFGVYDCRDNLTVFTAIDLNEPQPCPEADKIFKTTREVRVQIVQTETNRPVKAFQCQVAVSKEVCRCGLDSINYGCQWPVLYEPVALVPEQCRKAVNRGHMAAAGRRLNITVGQPGKLQYYSHGDLDTEGNCHSRSFTSGGIQFHRSYERTTVDYHVRLIRGRLDTSTQMVQFTNGIIAKYKDEVAVDGEQGTMVWTAEEAPCHETISEVYLGEAQQHLKELEPKDSRGSLVVVEKPATGQYAGLVLQTPTSICAVHGYATQIKGLVVIILREGDSPLPQATFRDHVYSTAAHQQAQLAYLHIGTTMGADERFAALWTQICEVERKGLFGRLQAIAGAANPYSLLDSHGPGHTVITAGAVAYVADCARKEATLREYHNCTEEIPVAVEGENAFADPLTMILRTYPTVIPCDDVLPVRWRIKDQWYCATPRVHPCGAPMQLIPASNPPLARDPARGLEGGLYSPKQMEAHQRFLVAHESRKAVLNKAAVDATSRLLGDTTGLGPPLSQEDIARLTHSVGAVLFPVFSLIGEWWSYVVGLLIALACLKVIIGVLIRTWVLYLERGWGCWMWATLWHTAFLLVRVPWIAVRETARRVLDPDPDVPVGHPRTAEEGQAGPSSRTDTRRPYVPLMEQVRILAEQRRRRSYQPNAPRLTGPDEP